MEASVEYELAAQRAGRMCAGFAGQLFSRIAGDEGHQSRVNLFVSPFSVSAALALALEGAQGETAAQLKKAIGYALDHDPARIHEDMASLLLELYQAQGCQLSVANALWLDSNFKVDGSFVGRAKELLAEASNVDFRANAEEARRTINTWVERKTKDKIKDLLRPGYLISALQASGDVARLRHLLLSSVTGATPLVITNAIYFRGSWQQAFNVRMTQEADFHLLDGTESRKVMMMSKDKANLPYARFDDHSMVQLPYKGNEVVMLVMLPHENTMASLHALCSTSSLSKIGQRQSTLIGETVNMKLPRFKFDFEIELSQHLVQMGIQAPFSSDADFSSMVAPEQRDSEFTIARVFHKAFVEVNEEGTEAAAATAVVMKRCRMPAVKRPSIDFVVDRPFVFVLYHAQLRCPLFIGKVLHP